MASQSFQAIKEADIVFFMVDVGAGITAGDRMIADYLRRSGKSAYLIANKIDGKNPDVVLAEFFELGMGEAIPIAAAHNRGITTLIDYVMEKLHPKVEPEEETGYLPDEAERAIEHEQLNIKGTKIAVVGLSCVARKALVVQVPMETKVRTAFTIPSPPASTSRSKSRSKSMPPMMDSNSRITNRPPVKKAT